MRLVTAKFTGCLAHAASSLLSVSDFVSDFVKAKVSGVGLILEMYDSLDRHGVVMALCWLLECVQVER